MRNICLNKKNKNELLPNERMAKDNISIEKNTEEPPPIFGSWKKIYFIIILNVFILIVLLYFFSQAFK
jgi:hypothetical protein